MNIYLTGMMGCGKTTLGALLAEQAGAEFLDMDAQIVREEGKSIPQIFAESGEDGFREIETRVLSEIAERDGLVAVSYTHLLRGGAYEPRTSPYAFQGLEKEGLEMLREAREATGLPIVSEIISPRHVEMFEMVVDVIQIGARNMQNFDLLKEVGKTQKPILLKRGL